MDIREQKPELSAVLSLVSDNDPILKTPLPIYTGDFKELRPLAFEMYKMMVEKDGIGLSANQVGRKERMFVMYGPEGKGFRDAIVAINPRVVSFDPSKDTMIEGCLSFPTKYAVVERSKTVRVEYTDLRGEEVQAILTEQMARVFQHEMDHLRGETMFDNGKELTLEMLAQEKPAA